jgi:MFS family permease
MMTAAARTRSLGWQFGLSAYWFATSMKWFFLLVALGPTQVEQLVPDAVKGGAWGRVVTIGAIWAMIGPALFGYLSDRTRSRFGKWRPYLAIGSAMTVVALMTLAGAKSYWVLVLGYLLLQISDDVATGPYSALIPGLVPEEHRGRASGVMGLLQLLAQIASGILAFLLHADITRLYTVIAVTNLICAIITLAVVREDPPSVPVQQSTFVQSWIAPWRQPDFRWVWFTRFLNALGFYLIQNYMKFFLSDVVRDFHFFGINVAPVDPHAADPRKALQDAAFLASFVLALVISLTGAVGAVLGGRLSDRIGRKKVIYAAGTLMAAVLPPFILFPNFTLILLLAVVFGLGYGAYTSADWALASDVMPNKSEMAKDMGLWQSSVSTPQIVSGAVGVLVDYGNAFRPGFGYTYTFLVGALAFALGTVLVRKIRGST